MRTPLIHDRLMEHFPKSKDLEHLVDLWVLANPSWPGNDMGRWIKALSNTTGRKLSLSHCLRYYRPDGSFITETDRLDSYPTN